MAPVAGGDLAFGSGSFGLSHCGQQHVRELEQDVAGGWHENPAVVERKVGMVFGGSGSSGDGSSSSTYSHTEYGEGLEERSIEIIKTRVIKELSPD